MTIFKSLKLFPSDWFFGNFLDSGGQIARLGIYYPMRGKPALRPLVLPLSDVGRPDTIAKALIDSGSDFDRSTDMPSLKERLTQGSLELGIYTRKMGVIETGFVTAQAKYGQISERVLVDPNVLRLAQKRTGQSGTLEDWQDNVAVPASQSSYCMLAIMQALAAPILGRAFEGGDEGFLVNLAGDSSRGKTTALQAGQSVIGIGNSLSSWDQTPRSITEEAAAFSDTLLAIDDLDKMKGKASFIKEFPTLLHTLVSGDSKLYSAPVKDSLPDLNWGFCGLTCARMPFSDLAAETGNNTEANIRVRCLDIVVPAPKNGGIWDRCDPADNTAKLSDQLKLATSRYYGTLMPDWLTVIYSNPDIIRHAQELIEYYCGEVDYDDHDGLSARVCKKFGLIYAAGILAQEAELIPWGRNDIFDVIHDLNLNALANLYDQPVKVKAGLKALRELAMHKDCPVFEDHGRPRFTSAKDADFFRVEIGDAHRLFVVNRKFEHLFGSSFVARAARLELRQHKVMDGKGSNADSVQKRISIPSNQRGKFKTAKRRYIELNVIKLLQMAE